MECLYLAVSILGALDLTVRQWNYRACIEGNIRINY